MSRTRPAMQEKKKEFGLDRPVKQKGLPHAC